MDFFKKLNRKGGIHIPTDLRRSIGLEPGERLKLTADSAGNIVLHRITGACIFCGDTNNLKRHQGKYCCSACLGVMNQQ